MRIRTAGVVAVLGLALAASGCGDSGSDDKPAAEADTIDAVRALHRP